MTAPPRRVVSLVPSETYNVARLGAADRLVGRTRYCVAPPDVASVPTVGGTKDIAVDRVVALAPDLVLANREENRKQDIEQLLDAGLRVRIVFPKTVQEGLTDLESLAAILECRTSILTAARALKRRGPAAGGERLRCFVPIWRNPWMTVNDDTYIGDVLRWLGLSNVFGDWPSESPSGKDTRYPEVTIDEVEDARPDRVLLPNEPYPFGPKHVELFAHIGIPASRVACVEGRDLCWHGAWAVEALSRLASLPLLQPINPLPLAPATR